MDAESFKSAVARPPQVRRRMTIVEWVVVVVIVGILVALFQGDSSTITRRKIERRARNWIPSAADRRPPDPSLAAPDIDIEGEWTVRRHLQSSSLAITRKSADEYSVAFITGACIGSCDFQRSARFRNGVLTLDAPVAEYMPATYDTLYAIRVNGEEFLLPAAFVDNFEQAKNDRDIRHDLAMQTCVYRRARSFRGGRE